MALELDLQRAVFEDFAGAASTREVSQGPIVIRKVRPDAWLGDTIEGPKGVP
jgi:hypothetical protein